VYVRFEWKRICAGFLLLIVCIAVGCPIFKSKGFGILLTGFAPPHFESLNSDGQQFHQYQQNKQPTLTSNN
jgi:hypothetical protein